MSSFVNSGQPQLFKYLYPEAGWKYLASTQTPLLTMTPKKEAATGVVTTGGAAQGAGTGIIHVWNYSNPQGVSQSFGTALANQDSLVTGQQLLVQLSQFYKILRFNAKELNASKSNLAAYMSTKKLNFDQALNSMRLSLDVGLHGSGTGFVGTVSNVTGNAITLTGATSLQQLQVGLKLVSATTNPTDGTAPAVATGSASVTKVSVTYGGSSFTVVLTVDNAAGFDSSTNKYVYIQGSTLGFSSTNQEGSMIGMGNWVPTSAPGGSDSFLGFNRSTDIERLSGFRMAAAGRTYREAIQEAAAFVGIFGGKPDTVLMNPLDWTRANIELQGFARYEDFKIGNIAFRAMVIASPAGGDLRLMQDPNQALNEVRILTMDSWVLYHLNDLVHVAMDDGLELRADNGADAFQMRLRSWPQFACYDPRANAVVTF